MLNDKGQIVIFADKSTAGSNVVSACVSDETVKVLTEICNRTGKKMSSVVRTLIEDSLTLVKIVGDWCGQAHYSQTRSSCYDYSQWWYDEQVVDTASGYRAYCALHHSWVY